MRRWYLHPLLLGIYPVVALLGHNINQIKPSSALRAFLVVILCIGIVLLGIKYMARNREKAALVFSLSLILFFAYGHIYSLTKQTTLAGYLLGRHRLLFPLFAGLFILGLWLILKKVRDPGSITAGLNMVALLALVFPIFQIVSHQARAYLAWSHPAEAAPEIDTLRILPDHIPPDIYYIILDGYTRADILQEQFQYDNSPFMRDLTDLGFYVAECSQSNYAQTELSLASSLNLNYLDALGDRPVKGTNIKTDLWTLIGQGTVRQVLERLGYTIVAFETGYYWIQWEDADVYLSPGMTTLERWEVVGGLNGFEAMLVKTSAGVLLTDAAGLRGKFLPDTSAPKHRHRERILFNLKMLKTLPSSIESPKFVYAHLIIPHEPFVFGPQGEVVHREPGKNDEKYIVAYRDQVEYINQRIEDVITAIQAGSENPAVIILQGDHGTGRFTPRGRMAILNAYYLPGVDESPLYESISPVNTFRVVFNLYFGGDFPLLEDTSYHSAYGNPYQYKVIPNDCR